MTNIVTSDLSAFGYRELKEAGNLLLAYAKGPVPEDFYNGDGVTLNFNQNSGFVFLSNENCDVIMLNGSKLETWYNCPECGHEGFLEDMEHNRDTRGCREYLEQIGLEEAGAA